MEAAILALRENMKTREVNAHHFEKALKKVVPSITPDIAKAYRDFYTQFRQAQGKEFEEPKYLV